MDNMWSSMKTEINRRSFVKNGLTAAGAATAGVGLLATSSCRLRTTDSKKPRKRRFSPAEMPPCFASLPQRRSSRLTSGFSTTNSPAFRTAKSLAEPGIPPIPTAVSMLDSDMSQYIHDNTDDEFTHQNFLNAYLASKGAATISLEPFRTLTGSQATGSSGKLRITNLTQLTIDTSWWTRYRDDSHNPDLDPNFTFPQAIPTLFTGQHTAIPRTNADTADPNFLQAIANTAGFHFATIEQGGSSLYPSMAQRATSVEVLRILISIGPTETMHFQTWSDKAGNAPALSATDPVTHVPVTFPDLNSPPFGGEEFQTNLIMPEPCPFLSRKLPVCSVIRPTETDGIAMNVVNFLTNMGLFIGQSPAFFKVLKDLAQDPQRSPGADCSSEQSGRSRRPPQPQMHLP